jgi:L-threonylcarbamoyladenylate synthase
MSEIGIDITKSARLLASGQLVAIPTETVYGLASNGLDGSAVARIFEAKKRPFFDPLILHFGSMAQVEKLMVPLPAKAQKLAEKFWPGPLTLVLPRPSSIPDIVTSGLDTVAVRMPNHKLTIELLQSLPFPLAAPSANPFGYISPTSAQHVADQLGDNIDYILDGGTCRVGIESTIISFKTKRPEVLRLGGLSLKSIEETIGSVNFKASSSSRPSAPGMLHSHYAPKIKLLLGEIDQLVKEHENKSYKILAFKDLKGLPGEVLSKSGDLNEAAQNLFAVLRRLDQADLDLILAEPFPNEGLGMAINDRLRRASVQE